MFRTWLYLDLEMLSLLYEFDLDMDDFFDFLESNEIELRLGTLLT